LASVAVRRGTVEGQSSGPRQRADAEDLALRRFTNGGRRNRGDGDRVAVRSEHLELVALRHVGTRRIVLDDHPDVAGAKTFLGKMIQIVRTQAVWPLGPVNRFG
jgi:hypothetical protein